jgi:hypothetical protein
MLLAHNLVQLQWSVWRFCLPKGLASTPACCLCLQHSGAYSNAAAAAAAAAAACRNSSGLSRCMLVYDAAAGGERRLQQVHNDEWCTQQKA